MKRRTSALLACAISVVLVGTVVAPAQAVPSDGHGVSDKSEREEAVLLEQVLQPIKVGDNLTIPGVIYDSESQAGKLPGVTTNVYVESGSSLVSPYTAGEGYVIGRARSWMTASPGYIRKGYVQGTFASIAGTVLGFVPGIAAMTVSAILSAVGIVASSFSTVQGETLVTYRYLYRDGEGRWSSDPNLEGYWRLGYRTGRLETYKHVIGGRLDPSSQKWTLVMKNYITTPAAATNSANYGQSDAWLSAKGREYVTAGAIYVETSW